jgi:hypothetical protein
MYAQPTHVFVKNYTSLRFDVSVEYSGPADLERTEALQVREQIDPLAFSEDRSMILAIPRELPVGEHIYTIKLTSGLEVLYLKQKCISHSCELESELGLSLESLHVCDPWFMNHQAKQRHEHFLYSNKHTFVIVYYAYDTPAGEDIDYVLYENIDPFMPRSTSSSYIKKLIKSSIVIPVLSSKATKFVSLLPLLCIPCSVFLLTRSRHISTAETFPQACFESGGVLSPLLHDCNPMRSVRVCAGDETGSVKHMGVRLTCLQVPCDAHDSEQGSLPMLLETQ